MEAEGVRPSLFNSFCLLQNALAHTKQASSSVIRGFKHMTHSFHVVCIAQAEYGIHVFVSHEIYYYYYYYTKFLIDYGARIAQSV
jgi:hypothetical protein